MDNLYMSNLRRVPIFQIAIFVAYGKTCQLLRSRLANGDR